MSGLHLAPVLVGGGAQLLMEVPFDTAGLADFGRRLRATKHHLELVADEGTSGAERAVCRFFECHQGQPKAPPRASRHTGKEKTIQARRLAVPSDRDQIEMPVQSPQVIGARGYYPGALCMLRRARLGG